MDPTPNKERDCAFKSTLWRLVVARIQAIIERKTKTDVDEKRMEDETKKGGKKTHQWKFIPNMFSCQWCVSAEERKKPISFWS